MTRPPLDSRIEMMIASLYGELSPSEEQRFQELRSSDPELQREWEELTSTRSVLGAWEFDEPTPTFDRPGRTKRAPWDDHDIPADGLGWWDRLRALIDPSRGLGWAVAAVAVVLLVFSLSGLRVEKVEGGFAFRMNSDETVPSTPATGFQASTLGQSLSDAATNRVPLTGRFVSVEDGTSPLLTRGEFDAYTAGMARVMSELVNSRNESDDRSREFNGFMRTLVEGMTERRDEDYRDLRGRIAAVDYGLNEFETRTNDRIDLIKVSGQSLTPQSDREGGK